MSSKIYLDYNATTPLDPQVLEAIHEALKDAWGNPSSSHAQGKHAKVVIEKARKNIADMIKASAAEHIVFMSGGTEANNQVIHSAIEDFHRTRSSESSNQLPHVITSNLEHDSIKLVLEHFERQGRAKVTYVPASTSSGRVEVESVLAAIKENTCLITIMLANNETGVIQPVGEIVSAVKQRQQECQQSEAVHRILLHTDAAQALGKICVDVNSLGVDYLTIVGHKFYGPRIGALYVRGIGLNTPLYPMFYGGGQERNYRPGTENTGMIAGLGKAAEIVVNCGKMDETHMRMVRDYLEERLVEVFGDKVHFNGKLLYSKRLPNTCNVSIFGEKMVGAKVLGKCKSIEASIGAACHSGNTVKGSHILRAIGIPEEIARNALRLSVGKYTTKEEIDIAIADLKQAIDECNAD